jgi:ATP-dependent DNA helicase RecG
MARRPHCTSENRLPTLPSSSFPAQPPHRRRVQDKLLQPHDSRPSNPDVANTFFRAGLIEAWGRGYEKIRDACHEAGAPAPEVEFDGGVRLLWQRRIPDDTVSSSQVESPVESQVLAALLTGPLGKTELARALGRNRPSGQLHEAVRRLVQRGAITPTIPEKPNSRLQKYRLTAAGKRLRRT